MGALATTISVIGALFVGFLQVSGWLLLPLGVLAVYGMRHYHPEGFLTLFSYVRNFVVAVALLALFEWVARLASLYMTGHQFSGSVGSI